MSTVQRPVVHRVNPGDEPRRAKDLELLANWMDSVFEIPGTGIRFGMDALIGLVPGLGDTMTSIISLYILQAASRHGVPRATLMRMAANIAADYAVGTVPVVGDVFDVYWKSNKKNVELLQRHITATPVEGHKLHRGDRLFVAGLIAGLVTLLVGTITISYFVITGVVGLLGRMFS